MATHNNGFAKYGRQNTALNTFGISNRLLYLGRINEKVTAKQAAVILIPVLRKAPNVVRNRMLTAGLSPIPHHQCGWTTFRSAPCVSFSTSTSDLYSTG
jgi:hypothetical protein